MSVVRLLWFRALSVMLAAALALAGGMSALPASAAAPLARAPLGGGAAGRQPRNVVVRWAPGIPRSQVIDAGDRLGFRIVRESSKLGWAQVASTRSGVSPDSLLGVLRANRLVSKAHVERIYSAEGAGSPNDPLYSGQWALENTGQTGGTSGADISATEAWTLETGSKDVIVAVVDTGMDYQHADLRPNIWKNTGEIPGNGLDDDGNGYADDVRGYDFGNRDSSVFDPEEGDQHATHVAGIIGAASDNGTGVAGVNWNVTIMPVKFLVYGSGTDFDGAEAIHYAVDNGADVINCSWGGSSPSELLDEAFAYAAKHGVLCVTAAGNEAMDVDEVPAYPGCIDSTAIINVAASDHDDRLADFSNYGSLVDLAAPGQDVTSTVPYDCAGVFVDSFPYKAELLAFPLEDVRPGSAAQELLARSLGQLAPMTDAVLVVDDSEPEATGETPGYRLGEYVDNLHAADYSNVTTWSVETQGVPPLSAMADRTVVWFTGRATARFEQPMITGSERAVIGTFLDYGGRLLMSSGEGISDLAWWDPEWVEKYLHVFPSDYMTLGLGIKGIDDTAFAGLGGTVSGKVDELASDWILPVDDEATPIIGLGGYAPLSGTSMAAPQVTGAAALLKAAMPSAGPEEIRDRLLNTVDPKDSLRVVTVHGGRLNVYAAMHEYPGRPAIGDPTNGDVLRAGRDQRLAWTTSPNASAEQTFEAQFGLPVTVVSEGFEAGTLAPLMTSATNGWTTTSTAHAGSFGAMSGSGAGLSSAWTTVTVPSGGGELSFWQWYQGDPWDSGGVLSVDDTDSVVWYTDVPTAWERVVVPLSEGEHRLIFSFVQLAFDPKDDVFGIDDLEVNAFDFEPLVTAPSRATAATFTVPASAAEHAKLRLRSHLGDKTSAWSAEVDVRVSTDTTPPEAPGAFTAVSGGDGDANLSWTNPSAGEGAVVRVLRRLGITPAGPEDPDAKVVYEGDALSVRDTGMKDGDDARYAAYAIDRDANVSAPVLASAAVVDDIAPGAVTKLQAGLSGGFVRLAWVVPPSSSAVRIVRRTDTTPTGPNDPQAALIYDGPGSVASDFVLTRHPFTGTAYYAAFPRDPTGNVGPRAAANVRIASTAMKGTLVLGDGDSYCTSTTVLASSSVPGAVRMRFDLGEGYGAWEAYAATRQLVLEPAIDGPHVVRAEYENAEGARLQLSASIVLELAPPAAPSGLKASGWNRRVKLTWTPSAATDVEAYAVYRGETATGLFEEYAIVDPEAEALIVDAGDARGFFRVIAIDIAGMESLPTAAVQGVPGAGVTRVAGPDRYSTAVQVSKKHFTSADTVVLATGENFADALSASGLAGSYEAPILLTRRDSLPSTVSAEIARLGAEEVLVIGSPSAISTSVAASLEASYTVRRIFGPDRYSTAAAVARAIDAHEPTAPEAVALVNGKSFADGTAVSAAAYASHMPVLLTLREAMPSATATTMEWLGVEEVYLIGGDAAISEDVEDELDGRGLRLAGPDRYATAAEVAFYFAETGVLSFDYVAVASGRAFPDALTGGAAAGKEGGTMLLSDPRYLPDDLAWVVEENSLRIDRAEVLGSRDAVTDVIPGSLQALLDQGGVVGGRPEPEYPEEPDWDVDPPEDWRR